MKKEGGYSEVAALLQFPDGPRGDLHTHSQASDGKLSATELVRLARLQGASFLAITDHDNMNAVNEGRSAGRLQGVEVLTGVELSCRQDNSDYHLLAYGLDPDSPAVAEFLYALGTSRRRRMEAMLERLGALGISLPWQEVAIEMPESGTAPCRPHLARALCRCGHVATQQEAFVRYIGDSGPAFVPYDECASLSTTIRFVQNNGGVAILAHPGLHDQIRLPAGDTLKQLDGLEVFHPGHSTGIIEQLLSICRQQQWIITGGSDSHEGTDLMRCHVDQSCKDALYELISARGGLM